MPFSILKEEVAKEFGIPVQFQRFWLWAKRQNGTYRPSRPLTPKEETQSVGQFQEVSKKAQNAELKLFLEIEVGADLHPIFPPETTEDDIIIFFKLYDPIKAELRYVGRLFVKSSGLPSDILSKLNVLAGFPSTQNIELYEEIRSTPSVMCEPIDKKLTFRDSQLENGDIICFQKSPGSGQQYTYPNVPSFLEHVHNHQVVHFRSLEKPNEEAFCLELSKVFTYDEVVEKVACQLGLHNPSEIRLTSHNCYTLRPKPIPIKYRSPGLLSDMLAQSDQTSDILYYEVLEENHYRIVKVARNEDLVQQIGRDIYFDLVDFEKVPCFRVQISMPLSTLKEEVAIEFGVPVQFQRFWLWAKRQNNTYRPHRPLMPEDETLSVGQLREVTTKNQGAELKLFLEVEHGLDSHPVQPPKMSEEDILLFFKVYDPVKEELRYVGRLLVKNTSSPSGILTKLNQMAGFSPGQEILLYEEIKFDPSFMCEPIDKSLTFQASQLQNGDIVCFQKSPAVESVQQYRYPTVPSFLKYVLNRLVVHFRPLEKPKEDRFCLELSKPTMYNEVLDRVACKLGIYDPSRVRLTSHDCSYQRPKPTHIMREVMDKLSDILVDCNKTSHILYYEVLEDKSEGSGSAQNKPSTCVICLVAPTEGACIPCGHMACCMSCLSEIKGRGQGCPICRAEVQQVVKIFAV